tara:strand:+ start:3257 stop:3454 length:198 start_codon:yes stop_codon:yes gene_type:complete
MKTEAEIKDEILKKEESLKLMKQYCEDRMRRSDWHGVEDAGSDIRDIIAAIEALRWVLTGETPFG